MFIYLFGLCFSLFVWCHEVVLIPLGILLLLFTPLLLFVRGNELVLVPRATHLSLVSRVRARNSFAFDEYDPEEARRCRPPATPPSLCIAVLSCNRPHYLDPVLKQLFLFLKTVEVSLTYEIIWIDQATRDRENFTQKYHFDKKFFYASPVGYPVSFRLAFNQCNHPYLFLLEEDWLVENMSIPWLSLSMDLLAHAPEAIYAILLRSEPMHRLIGRPLVPSCLIPSGSVWSVAPHGFHFTNGACVYRMSSIRRILDRYPYTNEIMFSYHAGRMGYCLSFWTDGTKTPTEVPMRFRHIGTESSLNRSGRCSGAVEG
jgi:hypothetical protein